MADNDLAVGSGVITQASLAEAYRFVLRTLEVHRVKATAAFVSCFAVRPESLRDRVGMFDLLVDANPRWFRHILPVIRGGGLDGWSGHEFYLATAAAGHDMAWHGTTHQHLGAGASNEAIALEFELMPLLFADLGVQPKSIVFPRNRIGQLDALRACGFDTYRAASQGGTMNRLLGLVNEWNVFDTSVSDQPCTNGDWHLSPAGHFLNWPSGARKFVPPAITVLRWKHLLQTAVARGGYVHMWFHPHNLITAPAMRVAFEEIMRVVGGLASRGEIRNLTMTETKKLRGTG